MNLVTYLIKNNILSVGKKLFIIPHQGLGDHLTLYGYIQEMRKVYPLIVLVIKENLLDTLTQLYGDTIKFYLIKEDKDISPNYGYNKDELLKILRSFNFDYHFHYTHSLEEINIIDRTFLCFSELFYKQFNLDLNLRFKFELNRNLKKEIELYNKLTNILGNEYIIVHDDQSRNFTLNKDYIGNYPTFFISLGTKNNNECDSIKSTNVFDYITILEKAKEIHVFDSFLAILVDQLQIKGNIYFHAYLRDADSRLYRSKFTYIY